MVATGVNTACMVFGLIRLNWCQKISEATVHFSLNNSQTCSWSQKYHLKLKITGFIQVEILECIYYFEVTTFVVYVQPRLVTALDVDESVKTVTVHVEPGSCTTSGC